MNTALTALCLGSIFGVAVCATVIEGLRIRLELAYMEIEAKRLHIERLTAQIQLAQSELL